MIVLYLYHAAFPQKEDGWCKKPRGLEPIVYSAELETMRCGDIVVFLGYCAHIPKYKLYV
jgi:hypothetical protein